MKKIVFGVYHDVNKEARSREMLECFCKVGKVDFVSYAAPQFLNETNNHIINKKSPLALIAFLLKMKKVIKQVKPEIILLHDNDCSALIPFIKKHFPKAIIFYDSSELYISSPKKLFYMPNGLLVYLKGLFTRFRKTCEKKYLKYADFVFAANIERAEIMKDYFGLEEVPEVFDNIHRIDDEYNEKECIDKFDKYFSGDKFNIIFAGGINEERKTFDYIKSFKKLEEEKYNLVILGSASPKAKSMYDELVKDCSNINYLGFVSRAELRYCIKKSQASVVIFDEDSDNTKFCASGKCYESLFEGIPILASENPPLKRLCDVDGVGVSSNKYDLAIEKLYENYEQYVSAVEQYILKIDYEKHLEKLTGVILRVVNNE